MDGTRERRKALGLCWRCGHAEIQTKTRCKTCVDAERLYAATVAAQRKAEGRCRVCNWLAKPGFVKCEVCLVAHAEYVAPRMRAKRLQEHKGEL